MADHLTHHSSDNIQLVQQKIKNGYKSQVKLTKTETVPVQLAQTGF